MKPKEIHPVSQMGTHLNGIKFRYLVFKVLLSNILPRFDHYVLITRNRLQNVASENLKSLHLVNQKASAKFDYTINNLYTYLIKF